MDNDGGCGGGGIDNEQWTIDNRQYTTDNIQNIFK